MSHIVIHVGTHKTATTHIQDTFYKNRGLLAKHNVIYPNVGKTRAQHGLAAAWINLPPQYSVEDPARHWDDLARQYAQGDACVFISSEEFSRLRPARVTMTDMRNLVSGFSKVTLLCTLRNQASFLQSVYQQISSERHPGNWAGFFNRAVESRIVDGLALDYTLLYDHFLTGFAPSEITFLSYDAMIRQPGGVLAAILGLLTDSLPAEHLAPYGKDNSNVSPNPLATFAANQISQPALASDGLRNFMTEHLANLIGPDSKGSIFAKTELDRLEQVFSPLNAALEGRIAAYQPDFSVGPMLNGRPARFRGVLDQDFWLKICRGLYTQ